MINQWHDTHEEGHHFEEILVNTSLLVFQVNIEGIIKYLGGGQVKQLGKKPKDLMERPISELFPDEPDFISKIKNLKISNSKIETVSAAGLVYQFFLNPIKDKNGKVIGVSGVGTDITAQTRMEIQLRESEERFRLLSDATSEGIAISIDGIIVDANSSLAEMLKLPSYRLLGFSVLDLFWPEDHLSIQKILTQNSNTLFETCLNSPQKQKIPVEVRVKPWPFQEQEALVITVRDITIHKEAEDLIQNKNRELSAINSQLKAANLKFKDAYSKLREAHKKRKSIEEQLILAEKRASLGTMAAGIAHEIAQPLNGLKITVDGMEYWFRQGKKIEFETIREKLKKVAGHANRINEIIGYMRSVFLNQESRTFEIVDLNRAILNTIGLISGACEDENIKIELELSENLPNIHAQGLQVEQVMLNLVQNSIQALHGTKTKEKRIQIKTSKFKDKVRLTVTDSGIGLKEPVTRIFDPFFTTHEAGGGMGLGLCIVQNLISSWNGKIKATNGKTGGAVFTIDLPLLHEETQE